LKHVTKILGNRSETIVQIKICLSSFRKRPCFWEIGGYNGNNVLDKKKDSHVENMEKFFIYQETKKKKGNQFSYNEIFDEM
jgi:hypothetical protein